MSNPLLLQQGTKDILQLPKAALKGQWHFPFYFTTITGFPCLLFHHVYILVACVFYSLRYSLSLSWTSIYTDTRLSGLVNNVQPKTIHVSNKLVEKLN